MKISDQIRNAADEIADPGVISEGEELSVDHEEKPEEVKEVPDKELADLSQGKVVNDSARFLSVAERGLLRKRGWTIL